ncbi:MAG: MerR family transcriptional regulator [Myxococcales bacterium]
MAKPRLTIGELSRQTGLPVKTLRFYSDEGLLPPLARTDKGYRLYGEEALVRIDLVRSLREAGVPLETIKRVLSRELSLVEALQLRLNTVEEHVAGLQRIAAALRAALRSEPGEADIRRLCAVTRLTHEERRAAIETFHERVSEGIPIEAAWRKRMVDASTPQLPDNPSPEQLDAWIELSELIADTSFIESLRKSAKEVWGKFDMNLMREAGDRMTAAAKRAIAQGLAPESEQAKTLVEEYGTALAAARGGSFDAASRSGMRERFENHDPRNARYWELVAVLRGTPSVDSTIAEWRWIRQAVLYHLSGGP